MKIHSPVKDDEGTTLVLDRAGAPNKKNGKGGLLPTARRGSPLVYALLAYSIQPVTGGHDISAYHVCTSKPRRAPTLQCKV